MLPDKRSLRILIFLLFVLVLTSFLSPWVAALANAMQIGGETLFPSLSLSDIFNRLFMIVAIGLFFVLRRALGIR